MSVAGDFRKLKAYRLAAELASDVHRASKRWPPYDRSVIGGQLVRAAYSVGANIAEANGRWHAKERRHLLLIARGSLHETEHWLLCAEAQGLVEPGTSERTDEIARLLNGLISR